MLTFRATNPLFLNSTSFIERCFFMFISFSPPDITEHEIQEVCEALRSGWITTGPRTKKLERKIAIYTGAAGCVCLNSQTACAEMALRVLGVGPGDEVIVPAYTYTATASVVAHVGAKLVMADLQPNSCEMDYDQVAELITPNTKAIIPVDLGGVPCDYDRLYEIVEDKRQLFRGSTPLQEALGRVAIMADTAHALGASRKGDMVGNIADFSSFSFHAVKNLTTAEGGALTWRNIPGIDNEIIYRQLQLLSLHGQSKDALAKARMGAWEYDVIGPWYKANMTDVAAAMGLAQMERYPTMLDRRQEIIKTYDTALHPLGIESLPHFGEDYTSSGHLYLTWIPGIAGEQRNEIIVKMAEKGIVCNVHYKPLPLLTAYKNMGFDIADYPVAYNRFVNEISLPLHTLLSERDVAYTIDQYQRIVKEYI